MTTILTWYLDWDMSAFAERLKLLRQARNINTGSISSTFEHRPKSLQPLGTWRQCASLGYLDQTRGYFTGHS